MNRSGNSGNDDPQNQSDEGLQLAADGTGPLIQRDYWAVINACQLDPEEVIDIVRRRFRDLAPRELVEFSNPGKSHLELGDEMEVHIRMGPDFGVRVADVSDLSITLTTLRGHAEAGKITFGCYRNTRGDVIFHIRSRARAKSLLHQIGFLTAADAMQTNTWTDFIDRLAHAVGDGVIGEIFADTCEVDDSEIDAKPDTPTFIAVSE